MIVTHVLVTQGRIPPSRLEPGENCLLAHRIINNDDLTLANGQPFFPGIEVDVGFEQGANIWLPAVKVRASLKIVDVYFLWRSSDLHLARLDLERYHYQVLGDQASVMPMAEDFFPNP